MIIKKDILDLNISNDLLFSYKSVLHFFTFFLFIYMYVFQPPFFDKIYYLWMWFFVFIVFTMLNKKYVERYFNIFKVEILTGALFFFIAALRDFYSGELVYADRFFVWFFTCLVFPGFILFFVKKYNTHAVSLKSVFFINLIYFVVICAGVITVLLILLPGFDKFYKSIQVDGYYDIYKDFDFRYRAYGVAENLSFTYGYLLGVFSGYAFLKIRNNIFNFIVFLILLVGVFFNARIGFIPVLFSVIFSVFFRFNIRYVFVILFSIFVFFIFNSKLSVFVESYMSWGLSFFDQLSGTVDGSKNTLGDIYIEMMVVPESLSSLLFGTGKSLYGIGSGGSDIGFVLQLNYAGIMFAAILFVFLIWCSLRILIHMGFRSWFAYVFIFSVFFLNTKGFLFAATPGARLIFLMYSYCVFKTYRLANKI